MTEKQFSKEVKVVRSDNGTEFMCMSRFFRENGIIHQTSCVATPQQNGRVERKHRHILNIARALLFQSNLPIKFWGEAILTAAYLINRTPSAVLGHRSPYELLYNEKPSYSQLRVFGSLCFVHHRSRDKDKFGKRSRRCVFVGYPYAQKGWKVFDLDKHEFFISRDVVFQESEFPYSAPTLVSINKEPVVSNTEPDGDWENTNLPTLEDRGSSSGSATPPVATVAEQTTPSSSPTTDVGAVDIDQPPLNVVAPASPAAQTPVVQPVEEVFGRGQRPRVPSVKLKDYVMYNAIHLENPSLTSACSSSHPHETVQGNSLYPLTDYITDENFSVAHRAFLAAVTAGVEPRSYSQAVKDKIWRGAMKQEVIAHEESGTWDIVSLPKGKKAIGCQWIYKLKFNADGTVERPKARLVACGNNQVQGDDFSETFAPVVKMGTIRSLLALVAAKGWEVHQMDVHNAFLHGDLNEEVYMRLPPGFTHSDPTKVCLLRKSLYGLRQAPRCWFEKLTNSLLEYGFLQSYSDASLFTYTKDSKEIRVLIYVDDLVLASNDLELLVKFKTYLGECFKMKDLGKLKYFLGIEVARSKEGIFLSQRKYSLDIIEDTGLLGCKPVTIPMEQYHQLTAEDTPLLADPKKYRRLVGRLVYLMITRPELCYTIHLLSQFMQQPREAHWNAALRVVRFLKGCPGQGILLRADNNLQLSVYVDADWSSCPDSRRSLSAYVVFLGDSPIDWKTKKQDTVSMSSAEAEYRAMAAAVKEVKWIVPLVEELGVKVVQPVRFYCDSKAAIHIAANPVFHERTKHLERDCHSVRDAVKAGLISTIHVKSKDQIADLLTKALGRPQFEALSSKLGVQDLHSPT